MLHATMVRDTGMTTSTTPTTPTPPPPQTGTIVTFPVPTTPTTPTKLSTLATRDIKQVLISTAPFSCVNNVCTATGQVGFTFQTLQSLINMANKKLGNTAIAVDGKIDARTVAAFMPVSRAVGGVLAIFDQAATPNLIATNADAYARGIAQWLGMTWVEATPDVPGHWERLRVGQTTVNLPSMPVSPTPQPGSVMQPAEPTPTQPPPNFVMYVCPDGTRVSDPAGCPKQNARPITPKPCVPPPSPSPGSQVSATYWDEYYACLRAAGLPVPVQVPPSLPPSPGTPPPSTTPGGAGTLPQPNSPPPSALPVPGATSGRYSGCIARFNRTRKVFSIYCPVGSAGAQPGLGLSDGEYFRCLRGGCSGLGEDTVTPPPPTGMVKAAEVTTLPGAGETQAGEERDKFWRLGNPLMWVAIAGAATVVGGGSYVLYRRKRSA